MNKFSFSPDFSQSKDRKISQNADKAAEDLRTILGNTMDLNIMNIQINGVKCLVVTIEGMVSTSSMSELVFRPVMESRKFVKTSQDMYKFLTQESLLAAERVTVYNYGDLITRLFSGFCGIIVDKTGSAVTFGIQGYDKRSVATPESEQTVRGSQDSFTETIRTNLSLVRRRMKTPSLRFEMMQIGEKSTTDVCMMYLCDRVSPDILEQIRKRLKSIRLDTVLNTGYIEPFIDSSYSESIFSSVITTERPDLACARLNEGKVCILVDGTPFCMICPSLFSEHFQTMDDYCEKRFYATFSKWLKYISFFLGIAFPGIYVALVMFHPEVFTLKLLLNLATSEEATPYPIVLEVIMLMGLFEIMREAGLRLPKSIGSTVSIVGGLIIGDAAVKSGLVSAPLLIVVGITATASFAIPSLYQPVSIMRLVFILAGGFGGLFGIAVCFFLLMVNINAMNDFNVSFTAPVTPFYKEGFTDVVSRRSFRNYEKTKYTVEDYRPQRNPGKEEN